MSQAPRCEHGEEERGITCPKCYHGEAKGAGILNDERGKHYAFDYMGIRLDPYRIMDVYKITHPAHQHALKKLMRAGKSRKLLLEDIDEVILTLNRWKLMLEEDSKIAKAV